MNDAIFLTNDTVRVGGTGWEVTSVQRSSPAEAAGLKEGWRLIAIAGVVPTEDELFEARARSHPELTFADEAGRIWSWRGKFFPFGAYIAPPIDSAFRKEIRQGFPDRQFLAARFADGDLGVFANLVDDFHQGLSGRFGFISKLGLGRSRRAATVSHSDDYEMLGFLGLGYAASGRFSDALTACSAAAEARRRVNQASYSGNAYAIHHMTNLIVAEAQGRTEDAIAHIKLAMDKKPEHSFLQTTYRRLTGEEPPPYERFPPGTRFPVDYRLPNHDPLGELPTHGRDLALKSTLAAMDANQILIILALGGFRSNYYANLDIERLTLAQQCCRGRIADVHIISSSTYALDADHRHQTEGLAQEFGLPLTILWDEDDTVMSTLGYHMSPARFCLDSQGSILSTAPFEEERGLWEAINTLDTRP